MKDKIAQVAVSLMTRTNSNFKSRKKSPLLLPNANLNTHLNKLIKTNNKATNKE